MGSADIQSIFQKITPERCLFVLSVDDIGKPSGMISGWNMKCSMQPPLFAVALQKAGYTHTLIHKSREFVVALPNKKLESSVMLFGKNHGNEIDKFAVSKLRTVPANKLHVPLLADAVINLECQLVREVDAGDHFIFIGEVVAAWMNKESKLLFFRQIESGMDFFEL